MGNRLSCSCAPLIKKTGYRYEDHPWNAGKRRDGQLLRYVDTLVVKFLLLAVNLIMTALQAFFQIQKRALQVLWLFGEHTLLFVHESVGYSPIFLIIY